MAEQQKRNEIDLEELTPDQCIDFAAGLLAPEEREHVLSLAGRSEASGELLRTVMAQAESARSAAVARKPSLGLAGRLERLLSVIFGPRPLVPAMAGAAMLLLGIIIGAGTLHFQGGEVSTSGAPARLISLFPAATRSAGPDAGVNPDTGLYIELNDLHRFSCDTVLRYQLEAPSGARLLEGQLTCHPDSGEWAGLFLPTGLMSEEGRYHLRVLPPAGTAGSEPLEYGFSIGSAK